jgi:hypothetical protein
MWTVDFFARSFAIQHRSLPVLEPRQTNRTCDTPFLRTGAISNSGGNVRRMQNADK